jgi:peptidoglycan hydrolase-like protein with peptidoglycan-binding domain
MSIGPAGREVPLAAPSPDAPPLGSHAPSPAAALSSALTSERFQADATLQGVASGAATLGIGAKGDAAKRVQLALSELGYDLGRAGADGVYGRGTASVVAQFQRATGLAPSGTVDAATLLALDARVRALDHPAPPKTDPTKLDSPRFKSDPDFQAIAAGRKTLARGDKGPAVEKLQWSLLSLGLEIGSSRADGKFGPTSEKSVKTFQREQGLPETGKVDAATLQKLDEAVAKKVADLKALSPAPEEKALRYHVVADLVKNRVYVLERGSEKPVASYLTSPGRAEFPTRGDHFVLQSTTVMGWWRPPTSDWAKDEPAAPPGVENPMGVCKLSFGAYAQYFHGIPESEEKDLGKAASHGCCRMSGANILEFHELYAGPGTDVVLTRDAAQSAALEAKFRAAGVADRPVLAGREYMGAYLSGEMGANEQLEKSGRVKVGGRGG